MLYILNQKSFSLAVFGFGKLSYSTFRANTDLRLIRKIGGGAGGQNLDGPPFYPSLAM